MLQNKIKLLNDLNEENSNIEGKRKLVENEIKKYKFSSDELIVTKWIELQTILDSSEDEKLSKFIRGVKGLVSYLDKYDSVYTYKNVDLVKAIRDNKEENGSFLLYPNIFRLKQRMRKNFYCCLNAPTGVGKTRIALNLLYQYFIQKKVCYLFSIEMTEIEIAFALIAMHIYYKNDIVMSKEEVEEDYNNSSPEKQKVFDSMIFEINKYVRYVKLDKYTPKNIYFAQTYLQNENEEIPSMVLIDHFHIMNSDSDIPRERQTAYYSSIADDLRYYVKKSDTVYFILGQMDNAEVKDPDYYEATGWKYTGDFAFHAQHYWKLFYDKETRDIWNLYNAKLRNDLKVYSPYQIRHVRENGAIINVTNEGKHV